MAEADRKDFLFVNCGGTGSQLREKDLTLTRMKPEQIIEGVHPDILEGLTWETINLWPALNSADVTSREHLQPLAGYVADWRTRFRSIFILVGTNTAVNVGAYVSFAMGPGLDIPITIASGQRHQGRVCSDSMDNIEKGLRMTLDAVRMGVREVMIYTGVLGQTLIRAAGAEKTSDNSLLIFHSPNIPPLARMTAHETSFSQHARRGNPPEAFCLRNRFTMEGIIPVTLHPDIDPNTVEQIANARGCRALVLESYETGNLPDHLLEPVGKIMENGVPVIVVPQHNEPNLTYRMPREEQNAVFLGACAAPSNVTKPTLYTKIGFYLTYGREICRGKNMTDFLSQDYIGEVPPMDDVVPLMEGRR